MRLPWPFGRRTASEGPSSTAAEDGGPGAHPAAAAAARSPAAPAGAWAHLPPIQRTVGAPPLVAPSAPFLDEVPGHRPMPPILSPLGHDVGPSAPPGLVVAHARPVPALTSHVSLPTRHVQRRTPTAAAVDWETPAALADATTASTAPPADAPAAPSQAPAPVRRLRPVAPAATVTPPADPLTRTTTLVPRGPAISRSTAKDGPLAGAPWLQPAGAGPTLPAAMSPGSGTPPARGTSPGSPPRTVSRWAEASPATPAAGRDLTPTASAAGPSPRRGARETASQPEPASSAGPGPGRRAGLGAPIASLPPTVAQRLPIRTRRGPVPDPAGTAPGPTASGSADAGSAAPPPGPSAPTVGPDRAHATPTPGQEPAAARPRLPVLPVARRSSGAAPAAIGEAPIAHPGPLGGGRPATPPAPGPRPTMGLRPIRPAVTAQREPIDEPPGPVGARWNAPAKLPPVIGMSGAGAGGAPTAVQLSPLGAAPGPVGPRPSGIDTVGPDGMREIVFPPRDTGLDAAPVSAGAGGTFPLQREPAAALPSVGATGPADDRAAGRRTPPAGPGRPLVLARAAAPAPSPAPTPAPRGGGASPVVARIVADPANPASPPVVQTSGSAPAGGIPVGTITATPVVQRVDGTAPPADAGNDGRSDRELDELARALFGRIRTHLRAEVIHEREAKGLSFDAF